MALTQIMDANGHWVPMEGAAFEIIDNLESSSTDALSAKQGKVLNDKFTQTGWVNILSSMTSSFTVDYAMVNTIGNIRMYIIGVHNGSTGISKAGRIENLFTLPSEYRMSRVLLTTAQGNGAYNDTNYTAAMVIPGWFNGGTYVADLHNGIYSAGSLFSNGYIARINMYIIDVV